jgi:molecular chaperone GrpE
MNEEINWQKLYDTLTDRYEGLNQTMKELRESLERRVADAERKTRESLYARMISMFDNVELLKQAATSNQDEKSLRDAVLLIHRGYLDLLAAEEIIIVDSKPGTIFNPRFHEAISMEKSDNVPEGYIVREAHKGFCQGNILLRPARVVVSSGLKNIS